MPYIYLNDTDKKIKIKKKNKEEYYFYKYSILYNRICLYYELNGNISEIIIPFNDIENIYLSFQITENEISATKISIKQYSSNNEIIIENYKFREYDYYSFSGILSRYILSTGLSFLLDLYERKDSISQIKIIYEFADEQAKAEFLEYINIYKADKNKIINQFIEKLKHRKSQEIKDEIAKRIVLAIIFTVFVILMGLLICEVFNFI